MSFLSKLFTKKRRPKKRRGSKRQPPTLESKPKGKTKPKRKPPANKKRKAPSYPSYRKRTRLKRKFKEFLLRIILLIALFAITVSGWFYWSLPDVRDLNKFTKKPSVLIKSRDGDIIGSFGDIYGSYITFNQLPSSLTDAVLATEDRNFYMHFGIDPIGLVRAMMANVSAGRVVQGGSTITQQVAKNVFLTPERSLSRKVKEMLLAFKLEYHFSKQDILSIYLNRVYLGAGTYGIDAAAKRYFNKSARNLSLSESAIMAGLLKAPSRFSPTNSPELARNRAEQVLVNMRNAGYLTTTQVDKARDELARTIASRPRNAKSTLYFADWILDKIPDYVGRFEQDIIVTTTLKPNLQQLAETLIRTTIEKEGALLDATQAAMVAMSNDGAIQVMIGGTSYAKSQYNRVTQALRQSGSAFKIFVYLAGLEAGLTPDSILEDKPISIPVIGGNWEPGNYTNEFLGPIPLKEAVTRSINTIAVQVSQITGLEHIVSIARRLGVTSDIALLPSIALGTAELNLLELTTAYAHLAADGAFVEPYGILEITDKHGRQIYRRKIERQGYVIGSNIVAMMNDMLANVVANGTGRAAAIGRPAAGKTGTTSEYKDAWFIGYTPTLTSGVWIGNDNNTPMKKVTGGMLPARIWRSFMKEALLHVPIQAMPTSTTSPIVNNAYPSTSTNTRMHTSSYPKSVDQERHERNKSGAGDFKLSPKFWDTLFR